MVRSTPDPGQRLDARAHLQERTRLAEAERDVAPDLGMGVEVEAVGHLVGGGQVDRIVAEKLMDRAVDRLDASLRPDHHQVGARGDVIAGPPKWVVAPSHQDGA
jgi:hypothetical protein